MILAAHQPHYLPWLGYFHKLAHCDVFIVVDDVQYEAQNYQNRNRVKINNGVVWLTVPLAAGPRDELVCEKRIVYEKSLRENWQRRTWKTLTTHYGRAPWFSHYAGELEVVYTRHWDNLVDLDLYILSLFMRWLGITCPVIRSSSLELSGAKTERIYQMCKSTGADHYLSGRGGSLGYLDVDRMAAGGVTVAWQEFHHPVYPQRYSHLGFVPRLGALDLIFNCGPASRGILLGEPRTAAESEVQPAASFG